MNINYRNAWVRLRLRDDAAIGASLDLPRRNTIIPALVVTAMFAIFAGILVQQIEKLHVNALGSLFDLVSMLFGLFWILGWSTGVLTLGALAIFLFFFGESARLAGGRLIHVLNVGPFKLITDYDLARLSNPRVEAEKSGELVRARFDYDAVSRGLGDRMARTDAERIVAALRGAIASAGIAPSTQFARQPDAAQSKTNPPAQVTPQSLPLASMLVLIAANLAPLVGVLYGGWKLDEVLMLYWAESAVVGIFTLLKMAVVGRWWTLFSGLFFIGHFGGFMAVHLLFIYGLFVRGSNVWGAEPGAIEVLTTLFTPLWPALLVLFLSHGVSFALNFVGQHEYQRTTVTKLMSAPYGRIVVMQFTLIFGGWVVMLLKDPLPALVLLIVLKVAADLRAHYGERQPGKSSRRALEH